MDSIEVDFVWICKVGVVMFVGKCFEVKVFIQLVLLIAPSSIMSWSRLGEQEF